MPARNRLWSGKSKGKSKAKSLSSDIRVLNPDGTLKEIIPVAQCKKPRYIKIEKESIDLLDNPRRSPEYELWRDRIKRRDKKTCILCGAKDWIQVHHIKRWIDDKENRYNLSNGVCLCMVCHQKHHAPDKRPFPQEITNKLIDYINSLGN